MRQCKNAGAGPVLAHAKPLWFSLKAQPEPTMYYETAKNDHGLPRDPFKASVAPRPIGWLTSVSAKGEINLAP
jgi:hypothetical protein